MTQRLPGPRQELTGAVAILVLGAGIVAFASGVGWWWLVFALGWLVLVPLVGLLTGAHREPMEVAEELQRRQAGGEPDADDDADDDNDADDDAALAALRERYARGEMDDAEFERRVETLLENEDLGTARESRRLSGDEGRMPDGERERVPDGEREPRSGREST